MHEHLNTHNKYRHDSQKDVVCNCEIETQGTRLERNQHDLGVFAVKGRTVENLLHGGDGFRLAFSFNLPFLRLALLDAGRDVVFKVVIVGGISGYKVRVIAIGGTFVVPN